MPRTTPGLPPVSGGGGTTKPPSGGTKGQSNGNGGKSGKKATTPPKTTKQIPYVLLQQPTFDPRIRRLAQPFGTGTTPLQRGHMAWDPNVPWPQPYSQHQNWAGAPKILFLYNPSTVAASYEISDATAQSALIYPVTSVSPILRVPLQQQISFTIMFDRTYELFSAATNQSTSNAAASDPNSKIMQQYGVELDILCVKQFTGMFTQVYAGNNPLASSDGSSSTTDTQNVNQGFSINGINQGVMQLAISYIYFGDPQSGLRFYGYIDSWDVQYTHFTQGMVPMRAVVDISFTLLPQPQKNQTPDGAAATAQDQTNNPTTGITLGQITKNFGF